MDRFTDADINTCVLIELYTYNPPKLTDDEAVFPMGDTTKAWYRGLISGFHGNSVVVRVRTDSGKYLMLLSSHGALLREPQPDGSVQYPFHTVPD